ncbi:protein FAM200C-like [Palaemon carinicauda]|uniref:protein FAM200C-like n=1 Tax=Palaemon carinicauda TaxID=392227 RepID=UPI0035B5BECE
MTFITQHADTEKFFRFENLADHGSLRSDSKSDFLECIKAPTGRSSQARRATIVVLDMAAAIHMVRPTSAKTFAECATHYLIPFLKSQINPAVSHIDVIWNTYSEESLKFLTHQRRGPGPRTRSVRLQDHPLKHSTTEHEQSLEALQVKRARYEKKGTLPQLGFKPVQKHFLQVSYEVAYQCIRAKASHSAPENWIKPCIIRMVELIMGTEAVKKMKDVPLSNNVIGGRVEDMSCVILDQIVEETPASPTLISLQLDESTDDSNLSQLIVYTRYIKDGEIKDEFLFCLALQTTTKTADVFRLLDEFFQKHQIKWEKVGSVCTEGAPAMMGNKSGFAASVKEMVSDIITKHCVLHRHALAIKTLPSHFKEVLSICVKVVNYIWGRALNHKVFKLFCEEMGSEHQVLLFHTEMRWLSRGKMLTRIAELADEIAIFLRKYQSDFAENFGDENFIVSLSYLADIFSHLTDLILSM